MQNYNAKLSNFGLAKVGSEVDKGRVSTRLTYGYAAPEYVATGIVLSSLTYSRINCVISSRLVTKIKIKTFVVEGIHSAKSGVYSFGVVLLEILSGRRVIDRNRPQRQQNLVEWAKPYLSNKRKILRVLDNRLEGQYELDGAYKVATLSLRCLATEAKLRPNMDEVVTNLEQLQVQNINGCNQNRLRRRSADDVTCVRTTTAYPQRSTSMLST